MSNLTIRARLGAIAQRGRHAALILATSAPVLALAQTDPFDDALTIVQGKAVGYVGGLVAASAAVVVVMLAWKYVKKLKSV